MSSSDERVDRRKAPIEPLIGYGWMHRSIFPESRSRTATGADLNRLGSWVSTRIGSAPPARFDDAQPCPLFLPPRRDELGKRSGSRTRRRFRAEPAAVRPASASRCWPRYVIPIATACEAASSASACTRRPRQSFGAEHSVRRCDLRCAGNVGVAHLLRARARRWRDRVGQWLPQPSGWWHD